VNKENACYNCMGARCYGHQYECIIFDCDTIEAVERYCENHKHWMSYDEFRDLWLSRHDGVE
jgi:hypothetical protein